MYNLKEFMLKYLVIGVISFAIVGGFLFWKFGPVFNQKPQEKKSATLTVWGLWEDESLIKSAIDEYKKTHPDTTINYKFNTSQNYRSRIQTQIREGQGPDIFMVNNSWLPMFIKENQLAVMPTSVMSIADYQKTFYPVSIYDFTNYQAVKAIVDKDSAVSQNDKSRKTDELFLKSGKIYGVPRGIDGLGFYYNEDILKAAGISVPQTWNEFRDAAVRATVADQAGVIKTAGAAMGLTGNVDHFSDILGLLFMQQPGARIEAPNDQNGADVLKFYTDFVRDPKTKVWDSTMESSTQAFAAGKLAFYFAPSWRASELRQLNPQLNFKVASVPQLATKKVGWANYWGFVVSSKSQFPDEAFEFLKFLASADEERALYQNAASVRLFGLPYSRVDLGSQLSQDPLVGAFVNQGPYYKSWYLNSNTRDQGLNDEMIKYYEDAVNSVVAGSDPKQALETTAKGVQQVLDKYVRPTVASPSP